VLPFRLSLSNQLSENGLCCRALAGPDHASRLAEGGIASPTETLQRFEQRLGAGQGLEGALAGSARRYTNRGPRSECDPSSFFVWGVLRRTPQTPPFASRE